MIPTDIQQIKPIETMYKGYRFRSRLEARWAVFFDAIGYEWLYEPEGFETKNYEVNARYLPDFYFPQSETWAEVKGTNESLKSDSDRYTMILDFDSSLPHFSDSYDNQSDIKQSLTHGLVILGQIPEPRHDVILHPIIQHHKGLVWSWFKFIPAYCLGFVLPYREICTEPEEWTTNHMFVKNSPEQVYDNIVRAYASARSARFEQ